MRTVAAMSLGVAAAIFIIGIGKSLNKVMDSFEVFRRIKSPDEEESE